MEQDSVGSGFPLDDNEKRRLVIRLITKLRCVDCGRLYDPEDFRQVHRQDDVWVLNTSCRHCGHKAHVVVMMGAQAKPAPVVDLTPEEMEDAEDWPPITSDDVLDTHQFLQTFEGDFEALFSE